MFLFISFLIVLALNSALQSNSLSIFDNDEEVERGDKFIDDFLKDVTHDRGYVFDPYYLNDRRIEFTKSAVYVNITGEAKLHNGYILGLKSLHRPHHCLLQKNGDELLVSADLGAGVLNFHYDGTVKFMDYGPTISVQGELAYIEVHMEFTIDAKTGLKGKLLKFAIDEIKGMTIEITGLGPLNWIWNKMIKLTTLIFSSKLRRVLEEKVRNHIAERLPFYKFPVPANFFEFPEL